MGWSLRKSFRLLPGIRVNLSKSGPRLSVGIPGVRASIDMHGKARMYGGKGPLRYQKTMTVGARPLVAIDTGGRLISLLKKLMS
jgi:hypothetical protein